VTNFLVRCSAFQGFKLNPLKPTAVTEPGSPWKQQKTMRIFWTKERRCWCVWRSYSNGERRFQRKRYIFSFFGSDDDLSL